MSDQKTRDEVRDEEAVSINEPDPMTDDGDDPGHNVRCGACGAEFGTKEQLQAHFESFHPSGPAPATDAERKREAKIKTINPPGFNPAAKAAAEGATETERVARRGR